MSSPKAVAYFRSLPSDVQYQKAQDLAKDLDCELQNVLFENVSGHTPLTARPMLQSAIGALESGDFLIIFSIAHLGREFEVVSEIIDAICARKITVAGMSKKPISSEIFKFHFDLTRFIFDMEAEHLRMVDAAEAAWLAEGEKI